MYLEIGEDSLEPFSQEMVRVTIFEAPYRDVDSGEPSLFEITSSYSANYVATMDASGPLNQSLFARARANSRIHGSYRDKLRMNQAMEEAVILTDAAPSVHESFMDSPHGEGEEWGEYIRKAGNVAANAAETYVLASNPELTIYEAPAIAAAAYNTVAALKDSFA